MNGVIVCCSRGCPRVRVRVLSSCSGVEHLVELRERICNALSVTLVGADYVLHVCHEDVCFSIQVMLIKPRKLLQ